MRMKYIGLVPLVYHLLTLSFQGQSYADIKRQWEASVKRLNDEERLSVQKMALDFPSRSTWWRFVSSMKTYERDILQGKKVCDLCQATTYDYTFIRHSGYCVLCCRDCRDRWEGKEVPEKQDPILDVLKSMI